MQEILVEKRNKQYSKTYNLREVKNTDKIFHEIRTFQFEIRKK